MTFVLGASRAEALISTFEDRTILVVGDVMLDHFSIGHVRRVSPEAPVPVVEFHHDEYRLGGAANVAHNIRILGGVARLVGLVGTDDAARRLAIELESIGIPSGGLVSDSARCTTRKQRIVTSRHQQVARVDYEDDAEPAGSVHKDLIDRVEAAAAKADVILVSDYLKGVVTSDLMRSVVAAGRMRGIPVLVDPKIPHIDRYRGTDLVTPNHIEAEIATHLRIRTGDEAAQAARAFRLRAGCHAVLITRGEHGMWLLDGSASDAAGPEGRGGVEEIELPAVAREVSDVTGAGDTVIGTMALAMAAGARLVEAATLANHAAGISVGRFGPATVTPQELTAAVTQAARGA